MPDQQHNPTTDLVRSVYVQHMTRHGDTSRQRIEDGLDRWLTEHDVTVRIQLLDDLLEIAKKHGGQVPKAQLRFLKEFGQTTLEAPHD
ncbi:MAG TPA: hypothetical protein VIG71_10690 [Enteractinococcus sp.]